MSDKAHMRKAELDISKKRIVQLHRILDGHLAKCLLAEIDAELVASQAAESEACDKLDEARKTIQALRQKLADAYNQRDEARKYGCPFPFKRRTECESDVRQLQQTRSLRSAKPTQRRETMNVNCVNERIPLQDLNDGDAFVDRDVYWIKTDHRVNKQADDKVGVVDLGSGSFVVWSGSVRVQRMPDLTVVNGDPVTK